VANRLALAGSALGLSLALASSALAQARSPLRPTIGPVAGIDYFTIGGPDAGENNTSREAIFAGVALTTPLSGRFFVQPQLLYVQKGAKNAFVDPQLGMVDGTIKTAYFEVPVLLGINLGGDGDVVLHLVAGPSVGIELSCDLEVSALGQSMTSRCGDIGFSMKTLDAGVTAGGGITFPVGSFAISLDARYTRGLLAIVDGSNTRNQGFSVGAGIAFALPRK
jgi:hypothetical protein